MLRKTSEMEKISKAAREFTLWDFENKVERGMIDSLKKGDVEFSIEDMPRWVYNEFEEKLKDYFSDIDFDDSEYVGENENFVTAIYKLKENCEED